MDAFLILHGLMLLSCDKAAMTCRILIANTPTHVYRAGVVGGMVPLPAGGAGLSINLPAAGAVKDPFNNTPSGPLKARALVLDGSKVDADDTKALYTIRIPMPDEVWGRNYVLLDQAKALNGTSPGLFEMPPNGSKIRVPETLVLRYVGVSSAFSLMNGATPVATSTPVPPLNVNALILTSWPDCTVIFHPHPSDTFDQMVKIHGDGVITMRLTETPGTVDDGGDAGFANLMLPTSVVSPPSCLAALGKLSPAKEAAPKKGEHLLNLDATGCGILTHDR